MGVDSAEEAIYGKRASSDTAPTGKSAAAPHVMIDSGLSVASLRTSSTSQGPSFISESEKLYCDMTTKILYPPCGDGVDTLCYQIDGDRVTLSSRPSGQRSNSSFITSTTASAPLATSPARLQKRVASGGACKNTGAIVSSLQLFSRTTSGGDLTKYKAGMVGEMHGRVHRNSTANKSAYYLIRSGAENLRLHGMGL